MASNERVGTLTAGGTAYGLRLAGWRPSPYRPGYRLVFPEFQDVPGAEGKVSGDPYVRQWHINNWASGEGEDLWKPGFYHKSTNVRPKPVGDGLVLGSLRSLTVNDNVSPATFGEARRFGFGLGKLWAAADVTVHEWQPATDNWDETGTATGVSGAVTSIVDAMNGTHLLIGTSANEIEKVVPGGANSTLVTGLAADPVLRTFGGVVYCLVGDDLWTVDATTGMSAAAVADPGGDSLDYRNTAGALSYGRLSTSDKGPIWFQCLDSGKTYIWEYNQANDTAGVIGELPVDFATPYSIFFSNGFLFVGVRYAARHGRQGDAYIYYQRGSSTAQSGVAGPIRGHGGSSTSEPVLIAGTIGDDLVFYYDGAVWAYNLSDGGIFQVGVSGTSDTTAIRDAVTFGKEIFLSNVSAVDNAERFQYNSYTTDTSTNQYSTSTATLETGRFDFGYLGVDKTLLTVTAVTDPLEAGVSVTLKYSVNGGAFTEVTGTHDTDGATSYTWTVSSSSASVTGEEFEFQLALATTGSGKTPVVRSLTARATGAAKQRSWVLELDGGTFAAGSDGVSPRSADSLTDFRVWAERSGVVKFTNVWDAEEWDSGTDYEVIVEAAELVEAEAEEDPVIQVRLREVGYV